MSAQSDVENAIDTCRSRGMRWEEFVDMARELWVEHLLREARQVERNAMLQGQPPNPPSVSTNSEPTEQENADD